MTPEPDIEPRQLEALLGLLPEVILLVGMDRKIRFINRPVEGYELRDILGKDLLDFVAPEFRGPQAEMFEEVSETGETAWDEVCITRGDGSEQWHEGMMIPLTTDGEVETVAIITRNVTERRRIEMEAEELRGLVPVCSWCKKIRDDQGYWQDVEKYVEDSSGSQITHSMCPECVKSVLGGKDSESA